MVCMAYTDTPPVATITRHTAVSTQEFGYRRPDLEAQARRAERPRIGTGSPGGMGMAVADLSRVAEATAALRKPRPEEGDGQQDPRELAHQAAHEALEHYTQRRSEQFSQGGTAPPGPGPGAPADEAGAARNLGAQFG